MRLPSDKASVRRWQEHLGLSDVYVSDIQKIYRECDEVIAASFPEAVNSSC